MPADAEHTQLADLDRRIGSAWQEAASGMGLRVTAPFDLPIGPTVYRFAVLVAGFGTPAGLLLKGMPDQFRADVEASRPNVVEAGYFGASVAPIFGRCDRDEFALFLNLFEWCGPPGERPSWHTGPLPGFGGSPNTDEGASDSS